MASYKSFVRGDDYFGFGMFSHYTEKPLQRLYPDKLTLRELTSIGRTLWKAMPREHRVWWGTAEMNRLRGLRTPSRPPPFTTYGATLPSIVRQSDGFGRYTLEPCRVSDLAVLCGDTGRDTESHWGSERTADSGIGSGNTPTADAESECGASECGSSSTLAAASSIGRSADFRFGWAPYRIDQFGLGGFAHWAEKPFIRKYGRPLSLRVCTRLARLIWPEMPREVRAWWAAVDAWRRQGGQTQPSPPAFSTYGVCLPKELPKEWDDVVYGKDEDERTDGAVPSMATQSGGDAPMDAGGVCGPDAAAARVPGIRPYCLICDVRFNRLENHFSNDCPLAVEYLWPDPENRPVSMPDSVPPIDPGADRRQAERDANSRAPSF